VWGNHYNLFGLGPNWNLILDGKSGTNSKTISDFRHCFLFITFISVVWVSCCGDVCSVDSFLNQHFHIVLNDENMLILNT